MTVALCTTDPRGKVRLSDLIAVGIQLSEIAAHEILDVKAAGESLISAVPRR